MFRDELARYQELILKTAYLNISVTAVEPSKTVTNSKKPLLK